MYNCYGTIVAKEVGCIEMKRHALLDLKACFVADDAYPLSLWDRKSDDWCEWEGVVLQQSNWPFCNA